jgi:PHD/YefM family antitoxin component YafN of YafNO toxin-antitoxin module
MSEPLMRRVSSADFVRQFSAFCDEARAEPVVLTRNGRDRLVIASVEQYRHLLSLALLNTNQEAETEKISDELGFLVRTADRRVG